VTGHDPYRLPRSATPSRYDLVLEPDLDAGTFEGSESVVLDVHEPADELVLNAVDLSIGEGRLEGASGALEVTEVRPDPRTERVHLRLSGTAAPGTWRLRLSFSGSLSDRMHGFYRSTYTAEDGEVRTIGTTQFESTDARRAFPCWDEPDLKAVFGVTLVAPERHLAISNGPELSREPAGDGRVRVRFGDTMPMSTYLVAFVVGPLEATEPVDVDGVPLRVIHQPGKGHLTGFALEVGAFCLRFFSDYYGIPYPAHKLDMVALPDFAQGAMENLGCITYRESLLLADRAKATQPELATIADVIAHEIAHMWFGDLVTMRWWNGIWLNEAFATFMELIAVDAYRPDWERWSQFLRARSVAFEIDALRSTRPVEYEVRSPDDAAGMFETLTYTKGAAVLRMLEQYLGPERFRDGIRRYLGEHRYGNTETHDLWDAIEAATGEPVRRIMDGWILKGGYPEISTELVEGGVRLTQRRSVLTGEPDEATWDVPLLVRAGGKTAPVLVEPSGTGIPDPGDGPVVVNAGAHAFVRVRYDEVLLARITGALEELSADERTQLVDDTWAAVVAGRGSAAAFCRFAAAFDGETEYPVWQALLQGLGWCERSLEGEPRERFRSFVRALVRPALDRVGWEPREGERDLDRPLRGALVTALGVLGADPNAVGFAREIEAEARRGQAVDASLVSAAVTVLASTGGTGEYEAFLRARSEAATPQEELRYLYALPDFRDPALVERTVAMALSDQIRPQNAPGVLARAIANREHGERAWAVVKERWAEVERRLAPSTVVYVTEGVRFLATPELVQDAGTFFAGHPIPQSALQLQQNLERQRVNAALRQRASTELAEAFASYSAQAIAVRSPFAPQTRATTCSFGSGTYAPESNAASEVAPPGSAKIRTASHSRRWASRIASSGTSTTRSTQRDTIAKAISPASAAPSESAAYPPTSTSTGRPASRAAVMQRLASGSTPITRVRPSYQAATPPISPPPPIATSTVSASGTCSDSSAASVPWPATTSGWSYACITSAPVSSARARLAASAWS
jgi:puromycin-sensitive aminopeptidase